ncbi:hypothetical protein KHA90_16325 [Flavobacterium psychroterrae]|uniref:Lipoprotein n=1 Tax=Flavobacterium psychroterrae TaxID=2133767 RepID=A0ABS5PFF6_9FLAO|nr:hypothetical protein [Flavobacterium psychroterrae]MBS7232585.1 hypothetical protein [Flavobacterium psychroterrae]
MKVKIILISLVLLFLFGCKKEEEVNEFPFDSFVLSYSGLRHVGAIKFTKSDTVYFQRRFPEPIQNFYAIIPADKKTKLNKYLQSLNLKKFESEYTQEHLCDGGSYLINVSSNGKNKSILIYGGTAPKELYKYANFLRKFKEELKFIATKKVIDFGDLGPILPPPLPPLKTE